MNKPGNASLANIAYIEELYQKWRDDPQSVEESWRLFFQGFELGRERFDAVEAANLVESAGTPVTAEQTLWQVERLIYSYRAHGHRIADVNPLKQAQKSHPDLQLSRFGFHERDLEKKVQAADLPVSKGATLGEIIGLLRDTYCGRVGVEYTHIQDRAQRLWLQNRLETHRSKAKLTDEQRVRLLRQLFKAELFETFVHKKFLGQKRFSLEGGESLIVALDTVREGAPELDIKEIVVGMPHRGRLNVLANIVDKRFVEIFSEFEDNFSPDMADGSGDVKYHRGYTSDYTTSKGKKLHISLSSNPSHLEAVNPVTLGRTRAKQRQHDLDRRAVMPVLIHGDAAFAGQGLVMETLQLMKLEGYGAAGGLHIIVNNQIGFTTDPKDARSTLYPTDIAKMFEAPVFHVNGNDPEAVVFCTTLAMEFRQQFGLDVFIDLIGYRKHGHNETDEPAYTQPEMYAEIAKLKGARTTYMEKLLEADVLVKDSGSNPENKPSVEAIQKEFEERLDEALKTVRLGSTEHSTQRFTGYWSGFHPTYSHTPVHTAVSKRVLDQVVEAMFTWPKGFELNRKIARQLEAKKAAYLQDRGQVDWAMAEALAIGSLLVEGTPVRLSGQDSRRGTFSQRHSVLYDAKDGSTYSPLNDIKEGQERFCVYNSPLSEAAVLGFDYGYSLVEPEMLILWEAQFGDFANGAQVIIDQFITSAEAKWNRSSGIVLLLPHGYEGMGPEHSSGRLERFLQACADDNIQVCNVTTPAQYFHLLRRQMKRDFRKPLIIMTPKSLLRHKSCISQVSALTKERFHEVIDDQKADKKAVKRVILASGKIVYELLAAREEEAYPEVAIIRMEQFYPWPGDQLFEIIGQYKQAKEIIWVQEEPRNMGGWNFFFEAMHGSTDLPIHYVGREASASPAAGSLATHKREQQEIIQKSFGKLSSINKRKSTSKAS